MHTLFVTVLGVGMATATDVDPTTYYMVVFAAQSERNRPSHAHSFATFVKRIADDAIEAHTISWAAGSGRTRLFVGPETGRNLTLKATLDRSARRGSIVSMWGPYRIDQELFARSQCRFETVESGRILWKALDKRTRPTGLALNCFHVLMDLNREEGMLLTGSARGADATAPVVWNLRRWIHDPNNTHPEIGRMLGLDAYCIMRRPVPSYSGKWRRSTCRPPVVD